MSTVSSASARTACSPPGGTGSSGAGTCPRCSGEEELPAQVDEMVRVDGILTNCKCSAARVSFPSPYELFCTTPAEQHSGGRAFHIVEHGGLKSSVGRLIFFLAGHHIFYAAALNCNVKRRAIPPALHGVDHAYVTPPLLKSLPRPSPQRMRPTPTHSKVTTNGLD